jgi:hypothetical protein
MFSMVQPKDMFALVVFCMLANFSLLNHSYDILGARMLWKPKEARILKNFIEF